MTMNGGILTVNELRVDVGPDGKVKGFGVKLLEGDNHWPEIMRELDKIGYNGWGITEMPGDQTKDAESFKEFSERVDKVFAS